jgi:hypothetical protein
MSMRDYEKLGVFYLGKQYDLAAGQLAKEPLLYPSKDLTTHGVCVGMTGSGKTGLCLGLLEEAAIDGLPCIAIDPKGDLGNLLLTFPELQPSDFQDWVDPSEAARQNLTVEQMATAEAEKWRQGLAAWDEDAERIANFRQAVDLAIYTPGSNAGLPLTVLQSFDAPPPALQSDAELLRDRVNAAAAGLLGLLGIEADPLRSREHILIASLLDRAWRENRNLQIASLIREIQSPPLERVGVMDLETFFPAKDRFGLALQLNNLLASPGFAGWLEGEPLDIQRLFYTAAGQPRLSILSIAHLSESERMFFVTILLNEVLAWVRSQPGTSSLRALLYMDEVYGYFPPTANPPAKTPMLTLLKQARAFGLGVMLATQNPVDLDYKGLSNAGTWFLGRLQTERDKARVLEGLEGASANAGTPFDRQQMEATLAGLGPRTFLMNNVHDDHPVVFQTRWTLSYLRGPLTRQQIQKLMGPRKAGGTDRAGGPPSAATAAPAAEASAPAAAAAAQPEASSTVTSQGAVAKAVTQEGSARPVLPPGVTERFLARKSLPHAVRLEYRPALLGTARLHYVDSKSRTDVWRSLALLATVSGGDLTNVWQDGQVLGNAEPDWDEAPAELASFASLPSELTKPKNYASWTKNLKDYLYQERPLHLGSCAALKVYAAPDESEADFRVRLRQRAREQRDQLVEKLRKSYAPKLRTLADRLQRAEQRVEREKEQYRDQKMQTALSFGTTLLTALFSRKLTSVGNVGRAASAVRGAGRSLREQGDVGRAEETVETVRADIEKLEAELNTEVERAGQNLDPEHLAVEEVAIRPRKADIAVEPVTLVWTPWLVRPDGTTEAAYATM